MKTQRAKKGSGTLQKRGGVFYAVWKFEGRRYAVSTKEKTEREARKRLAEIMADFQKGHNAGAVLESVKESLQRAARHNLRIADAWDAYERNKLRRAVADSTLRVYRLRFAVFARWAAGKVENVDDVTAAVARRFMAHIAETASPKTFNDFLAVLSLTWKTFVADGRAAENPWTGIERKDKDTHTKCELTAEQLDALFNATSGEMRTLFFVGIYTGLRLKDCALLKWDAVDLEGGFIRIVPEKTKRHGISVSIPILPPLAEALRAARDADEGGEAGGYVLPELADLYQQSGGKYISNRLKFVFKRAGITTTAEAEGRSRKVTDYGFHSLRHTFVSMAARAGIRQAVVQSIVGHTNAAMTAHYTHTNEADLRAAMAAFPAIVAGAAETRIERAEAAEVAEIPAEAETGAEGPMDALAAILARLDADGLKEAARMLAAERRRRA